jgi:RNA recognition motif-containing protein
VKNIFVGNLSFDATDGTIRSLFERYGSVERVHLVTDRDQGTARGFGFVEMVDASEADRAIAALNGCLIEGRALSVNEARSRGDSTLHNRKELRVNQAVHRGYADDALPNTAQSRSNAFSLRFEASLSPEQIMSTLTALADYYRVCGGVGLKIEFGREILRSESDRG